MYFDLKRSGRHPALHGTEFVSFTFSLQQADVFFLMFSIIDCPSLEELLQYVFFS